MTASAVGDVVISRSRLASTVVVAMQRPGSQLANGIFCDGNLPTRSSTPGGMTTPVGVCMTATSCLRSSIATVQVNTIWLVFCCRICNSAEHRFAFGPSANSLQVTAQFSKLRISVRVGTCGGAGACAAGAWPEGTAGAGVTCPVVGNRGALAGGGFCVTCASRTPSAGPAGSVQNQNANPDNPIRNAHLLIPVLLLQFPRGLPQRLIRNSPVSFRQPAATLSSVPLPLLAD